MANAGSNLRPRSWAIERSSPRYQRMWKRPFVSDANMWAESRPPNTRIVVSKTCGFVFTSIETHPSVLRTAVSNPLGSSMTIKVSRTSNSVREKLPATSLMATLCLRRIATFSYVHVFKQQTHGFSQSGPLPVHDSGMSFTHMSQPFRLLNRYIYLVQRKGYEQMRP